MKQRCSKDKLIYKSVSTFLIAYLWYMTSLPLPTAYAQEVSLKVAPSVLQIHSSVPNQIQAPFSIENQGTEALALNIGYKIINKSLSQEGKVTFLNDTDTSTSIDKTIFSQLQVIDENNTSIQTISLGPKQVKKLQLRITLPPDTPTNDYYFSLIFTHENKSLDNQTDSYINKKDQKSVSAIQTGIALNVLLSTGGDLLPQASIYTFSTPFYASSGPIPFTIKVTNNGSHYINPRGEIQIKNVFGQTVATVSIPPQTILSGTTRTLADTTHYSTKNAQVLWPQKFLLGVYNATLRLSASSEGPYYTKNIHFIAFPLIPSLALAFSLCIAYIIYRRVKNKLR